MIKLKSNYVNIKYQTAHFFDKIVYSLSLHNISVEK